MCKDTSKFLRNQSLRFHFKLKNAKTTYFTLDAIANKDAMTYYIAAIVAARTNNSADVQSNLKKAVSMNSALKAKAATDLEFAKFASVISAL